MKLEFGQWLKKRRRGLDLTQDDLADRAFCSVNTIRKLEAGALVPSKALALEIARALAVPAAAEDDFVRFARTRGAAAAEDDFSEKERGKDSGQVPAATAGQPPVKFRVPLPLTAALGREHDIGVVTRVLRLRSTRVVTLTGPPGTGKTRLALEVANELGEAMEHGAAFVPLAPITQPALVENAIAQVLDVHESAQTSLRVALRAFVAEKELLLVLDTFEHVLEAVSLVGELLGAARGLKVLATSREPLRLYGEHEIQVSPLALPGLPPPPPTELERFSAIQLFVERAQAVNPEFELTSENADAVAQLCVELDGLPLAIEMAAARVKWETPNTLLAQWQRRAIRLEYRARDREARQQTLRGAVDWSYERLSEREQSVFRYLGVFRGGFTKDAAAAVANGDDGVGDGLPDSIAQNLAEKSLLKFEHPAEGTVRYEMLEVVRKYALEKMAPDEMTRALERHAGYFTELIEGLAPDFTRADWTAVRTRINADQDNLRAAFEWALDNERGDYALRLGAELAAYWEGNGAFSEGIRWLKRAVAIEPANNPELRMARARVRDGYARLLRYHGNQGEARTLFERAVQDWKALGAEGKPHLALAWIELSWLAGDQGDDAFAFEAGSESLRLYTELGDAQGMSRALRRLCNWALTRRDLPAAEEYITRAWEVSERETADYARIYTVRLRAEVRRAQGRYAEAERDFLQGLELNEGYQDAFIQVRLKYGLAMLACLQNEPERGAALLQDVAQHEDVMDSHFTAVMFFCGAAFYMTLVSQPERASMLLGGIDRVLERAGAIVTGPERLDYEASVERLAAQADAEQLEVWRSRGRELTVRELLAMWREGEG